MTRADPTPPAEGSASGPWLQFICRICGLIYDERVGDADSGLAAGTRWNDIPDDWACPICGVGKADFEPYVPPAATGAVARTAIVGPAVRSVGSRRDEGVVIVGAGRAGWAAAQALRSAGWQEAITLVSACAGDVYDKPQLSVAVARGLDPADLVRESAAAAAARLDVRLRSATSAVAVDAPMRRLRTTRGALRYRHLILAQGAEPALPAVLPAAQVWRINDLSTYQRLRAALASGPQRVLIVGAGLVGCELANDLALAGHQILLLDTQARPLAAQLPAVAGERLLRAWQGLPIEFFGGVQVTGVLRAGAGSGSTPDSPLPLQVSLKDGRSLAVHQVIAATGLRAASRLARSAGLDYEPAAGGITVSAQTGATSVAGISALGDCVVVDGRASRYIEPIARQAQAIAAHILGQDPPDAAQVTPVTLRVKTSALNITLTGLAQSGGTWQTDSETEDSLRLVQRCAQGNTLATLQTRLPAR